MSRLRWNRRSRRVVVGLRVPVVGVVRVSSRGVVSGGIRIRPNWHTRTIGSFFLTRLQRAGDDAQAAAAPLHRGCGRRIPSARERSTRSRLTSSIRPYRDVLGYQRPHPRDARTGGVSNTAPGRTLLIAPVRSPASVHAD